VLYSQARCQLPHWFSTTPRRLRSAGNGFRSVRGVLAVASVAHSSSDGRGGVCVDLAAADGLGDCPAPSIGAASIGVSSSIGSGFSLTVERSLAILMRTRSMLGLSHGKRRAGPLSSLKRTMGRGGP